jgi:trk system potassium uptake protein TrkH
VNRPSSGAGGQGGTRRRHPRYRAWLSSWLPAISEGPDGRSVLTRLTPVQLLAGSFLLMIIAGTIGFRTLPGLYTGARMGWLDSLFTATSAVCVTGLIVVDTATAFTPLGQAFILVLIQLGGLGMLTFASLIILGLGRRHSLQHEELSLSVTDVAPQVDTRRLTWSVIRLTLMFEALAAVILWLNWGPRLGWGSGAWHAVFHAVSAFCNAGFSTFSDSLASFQSDPVTLVVVIVLIVAGSLGFLTLHEIERFGRRREGRARRLSLHSRLAIAVTLILLVSGAMLLTAFEWNRTLATMSLGERMMNGLFMSVTARTAGFNTVDYGAVTEASAFLTIILMFIGGSSGGTAGGVKTTTIALIVLLALARIRGHRELSLWNRTVPAETLQRAIGLVVLAFILVTAAILVFTVTALDQVTTGAANSDFLARVFEVTSAFGTVGLSTGLTADLTVPAKCLTILLMFVGRIGPLAMAAAISLPVQRKGRFRYAHEDIIIG